MGGLQKNLLRNHQIIQHKNLAPDIWKLSIPSNVIVQHDVVVYLTYFCANEMCHHIRHVVYVKPVFSNHCLLKLIIFVTSCYMYLEKNNSKFSHFISNCKILREVSCVIVYLCFFLDFLGRFLVSPFIIRWYLLLFNPKYFTTICYVVVLCARCANEGWGGVCVLICVV